MLSIEQALTALQREILLALPDTSRRPARVVFQAEKVVVSLGLQLNPDAQTSATSHPFFVAADSATCVHHVTIEFRLNTPLLPDPPVSIPANETPRLPANASSVEAETDFATLCEILGAPGFDSSARATVFRETLENLSESQRREVLASLTVPTTNADEDTSLSYARHLIRRLVTSGPAGFVRGSTLLVHLARQSSVNDLMRLAALRWRTQSEWANTPDS